MLLRVIADYIVVVVVLLLYHCFCVVVSVVCFGIPPLLMLVTCEDAAVGVIVINVLCLYCCCL